VFQPTPEQTEEFLRKRAAMRELSAKRSANAMKPKRSVPLGSYAEDAPEILDEHQPIADEAPATT
jgi:hypothetical protein